MIGSVYRIQFRNRYKPKGVDDIFYIGSTTKTLKDRWSSHRVHFRKWLREDTGELSIFKYFKEYGFSSFEIVEIKRVIICDWQHLLAHEQLAINKNKCVNKLPCFNPVWRQNKIDKYNEYYAANRDQILAYQNEKFTCECGGKYTRSNKNIHLETKKHKKFVDCPKANQPNIKLQPKKALIIETKAKRSMPFIDESNIILFGKHKGKHIDEIISSNLEYCLWLRDHIWIQTNERVMNKLNSNKAIRHAMIAGPHKGCTVAQIQELDPAYVEKLRNDPVIQRDFPFIVEQL